MLAAAAALTSSRQRGLALASAASALKARRCYAAPAKNPDYIVLGAGSAGCVLTDRLSEDGQSSVTLLEAGGPDRGTWDYWKIQMPAALTFNLANDKYNWDFHTLPQKGLAGRSLHQPRGKALGGSSSLNAMVYIRGHAQDFERWSKEGAPGWSYADVLPYFKRAQSHNTGGDAYKGSGGPLQVKTVDHGTYHELFEVFIDAGVQAGYPRSTDLNGFSQEGFGLMDMTISPNGERCSAANAYLRGAEKRPNVDVQTHKLVTKIIFEGKRAVGVEYTDYRGGGGGKVTQLRANKEVIVSLGAVGSPQLLMLSGIGPGADLKPLGIEPLVDNPEVGQNLQDHLEFYQQFLCEQPVTLYPVGSWWQPHKKIAVGIEWFLRGTGPAASNQFESGGFVRTRAGLRHPDLQYHFIPGAVVGQLDFLPHHAFQFHTGTLRPTSRGSLKLASADPRAAPLIDPNYLDTEDDMEDLRRGFRLTEEIVNQPAFDKYRGKRLSPEPSLNVNSDAEVDNWIRNSSHSAYHPSCTCAMGAVVDEQGRVHGVEGLRVVDASIMPSMTSGNLNAPTIMLAEKCADAIRGLAPLAPEPDVKWYEPENWQTKQREGTPARTA